MKMDKITRQIETQAPVQINVYGEFDIGVEDRNGTEIILSKDGWTQVIVSLMPELRQQRQ